ncbi:MAG: FHA domain-containing protein [Planctomycetes bacterium]|nr:FHA domain-containing protein [Planctomycetota bacterium]
MTVGRAEGSGMLLPDGGVSKRHATLGWDGDKLMVEDHGSTNGTYVNRRKIESGEKIKLRTDDQIRFGFGETFQVMSPPGLFRYMEVLRRFGF